MHLHDHHMDVRGCHSGRDVLRPPESQEDLPHIDERTLVGALWQQNIVGRNVLLEPMLD